MKKISFNCFGIWLDWTVQLMKIKGKTRTLGFDPVYFSAFSPHKNLKARA
jgi:hypothetical protein